MSQQTELEQAVTTAGRALLTLYGLMAAHGIPDTAYLQLMLSWPAGMRDAHRAWMAGMVRVVNALGHAEGIQHTAGLSERDKIQLAIRAHDLVLNSQAHGGIRSQLAAITGVTS